MTIGAWNLFAIKDLCIFAQKVIIVHKGGGVCPLFLFSHFVIILKVFIPGNLPGVDFRPKVGHINQAARANLAGLDISFVDHGLNRRQADFEKVRGLLPRTGLDWRFIPGLLGLLPCLESVKKPIGGVVDHLVKKDDRAVQRHTVEERQIL